ALASGVTVRRASSAGQPIGIALFAVGVLLALVAWSALLLQQRAIIEQRPTSIKSELGEALRRLPSFFVATLLFLVVVGSGVAVGIVVSVLLGALIAAIVSSLGAGIPVMTSVFTEVANVLGAVTAPFAGALLLGTFADLRVRKEGTDLKQRIVDLAVE